MLRSEQVARDDLALSTDAFRASRRPVIRWIKCDGLDDPVTRAAIAQATRLIGDQVDYALCTYGLDAARVRAVLEWAEQPVQWIPVSEHDNPELATELRGAGCPPERFGYWWKWFPERVRPKAPEWILDGDMVITGTPAWFGEWISGRDPLRVSQDDRSSADGENVYGRYQALVDADLALYSGLASLPPDCLYVPEMLTILRKQPLQQPHDGIDHMCEQGVVAAAFQRLGASPIPLNEFPFARAFEDDLDFGLSGDAGRAWGYHFGNAFRRDNPHFGRLTADDVVYAGPQGSSGAADDAYRRNRWLGGGSGQWGVPGWGMPEGCVRVVSEVGERFRGRDVLDLGTSRGRLAAMLCDVGCRVTTVDLVDRGAAANLQGLPIDVILDDAVGFMEQTARRFDLICVDVHGNSPTAWRRLGPALKRCLARRGALLMSNVELWKINEWVDETGAWEFVQGLGPRWRVEHQPSGPPGMALATRRW